MSNQKGLVQRIERKLENTVGDAFARVFGGSIVPQEVEALLRREASDGVQTLPGDRFLAPNYYVITLSGSDFEKVSADRDLTSDTFAKHLEGYILNRGGKRMVMWSSDSSSRRTCTPASIARVASSIRMPTPTCPQEHPPQQNRTMRSPQNQEYHR